MRYAWIAALTCLSATFLSAAAGADQPAQRPPGGPGGMQRFEAMDTDGDGKLSRAETEKGPPMIARNFDRFDANKDGFLTKDELQAGMRSGMQQMQHRSEEAFKKADTNGDGKLSKEEASGLAHVADNFSAIDANGDGFLTQEELRAHAQSMMRDRMRNRGQE